MVTTSRRLRERLLIVLVAFTTSGLASAQAPAGQKAAPGSQKQPAAQTKGGENYRVVTEADGLSCRFSQDIGTSFGIVMSDVHDYVYINPAPPKSTTQSGALSGTMWSIANHFKCKDSTGMEKEIELINKVPNLSADIKNKKVMIRTRDFATMYLGMDDRALEMTESQIKKLKTSLGF